MWGKTIFIRGAAFRFDGGRIMVSEKYRYAESHCRDLEGQWEPWHDCMAQSQTIYEVIGILKIAGLVLFGVFLIGCLVYRHRHKIQKIDKAANE
jgi:hypothetical protein